MSVLSPLTPVTLVDQICEAVRKHIEDSKLQSGSRLPSERDLARNFGCSRNAVREALTRLQAEGVLVIRTGRGAFVKSPDAPLLADKLNAYILEGAHDSGALMEGRLVIEAGIMNMVIEKIDKPGIARLRALVGKIESSKTETEAAIYDIQFHETLAQIADSPILAGFSLLLREYVARGYEFFSGSVELRDDEELVKASIRHTTGQHREILNAIISRDRQTAQSKLRTHLLDPGVRWRPRKTG